MLHLYSLQSLHSIETDIGKRYKHELLSCKESLLLLQTFGDVIANDKKSRTAIDFRPVPHVATALALTGL